MNKSHEFYMRRALELAALGAGRVAPNPMVGAVVVARGRIIGEGFHAHYGGPHAEVNAIRSVPEADRPLLREATIYVTLEPCSHYGKTPPCAKLIIDTGIPHVVMGAPDPNPKVNGKGVQMLRDAGVEVTEHVLEEECIAFNRRFMTAQTLHRPYIQLKWAQTTDGFIAASDGPIQISTPITAVWMHRERSMADAIMVGVNTVITDNPRLDCRLWPGKKPIPVSFDSPRLPADSNLMQGEHILMRKDESLQEFMHRLLEDYKIQSLMIEGGAATLQAFIDAGLYDEIRVETSLTNICAGISAPILPSNLMTDHSRSFRISNNQIKTFVKNF